MKLNQKGFGLIEVLLILILMSIVGFAGWYVGSKDSKNKSQNASNETAKVGSSSTKAQVESQKVDDKQLITAAVKAKNPDFNNIGVNVREIQGNYARGSAGAAGEGGFAFIAVKENNQWSVVFQGQQNAGKEIGEKYNLPEGWYSTDY